ncbi:NAD(P)/FAD-dependent oxidoreductase [Limimaricola cinnabarinus]|uniref:NAD(P)/FAD-dependent oxidoreductase n=1 Tax=Limimaricola cinnabarinus TaxID=1125964 RepID=UPI00249350C3|nr:FAD-dependent oxidoreductase [Limimaricola cinnabarinus]
MAPDRENITIIGGGIVGLSVALGLLRSGQRVVVLDGADADLRASQGNFGLVWLQGKGADHPAYARWTRDAVAAWPEFSSLLRECGGVDVALRQAGGYEFFTDETELRAFAADLERQQAALGNRFAFEVLSGDALRRVVPGLGPGVAGATHSALDGDVNPLRLLAALQGAVTALGGSIEAGARVTRVSPISGGGFDLALEGCGTRRAERVVLCAGLGSATLAEQLGFHTRVRPQRGEMLITEKIRDRLPVLSSTIRQVNEGGIQIGGTKADAGFDDRESLQVMSDLARHAVAVFPALADVRVVRGWGSLRVMTPDGYPVYARAPEHPGAFLVTCHSGVTLAPMHATALADWIAGKPGAPDLEMFDDTRFALPDAA